MVMRLTCLTLMVGRIQLVNEDGVVVEPKTHVTYWLWPDRAMKERLLVEKLKTHAMHDMHAMGGTEGVDKDSLGIRRKLSSGSEPIEIGALLQDAEVTVMGKGIQLAVIVEEFMTGTPHKDLPGDNKRSGIVLEKGTTYTWFPATDHLTVSAPFTFGETAGGGHRVGSGRAKSGKLSSSMMAKLQARRGR